MRSNLIMLLLLFLLLLLLLGERGYETFEDRQSLGHDRVLALGGHQDSSKYMHGTCVQVCPNYWGKDSGRIDKGVEGVWHEEDRFVGG